MGQVSATQAIATQSKESAFLLKELRQGTQCYDKPLKNGAISIHCFNKASGKDGTYYYNPATDYTNINMTDSLYTVHMGESKTTRYFTSEPSPSRKK